MLNDPIRVGITVGDPSGIGPEIVSKVAAAFDPDPSTRLTVFGPGGLGVPWTVVDPAPEHALAEVSPGEPDAACALAQRAYLDAAILAAQRGELDAIVTAPWTKAIFELIDQPALGHTEVLAEAFGVTGRHAMMLAGDRLRVVLVTTHIPLRAVADALSPEKIADKTTLAIDELRSSFGVAKPSVAVLGLNPHAGEGGHMGHEEIEIIRPAIDMARTRRPRATIDGPFSPDTFFARFRDAAPFDSVVCMYHDQGLIPLKTLHFGESANITLGLPIVRTSVDHGTAHDIAGAGQADPTSLRYALDLAVRMTRSRRASLATNEDEDRS